MNATLIITAHRGNQNRQFDGDLCTENGRIKQVGDGLAAHDGELMVDAACPRLEFNQ